MAKLGNICVRKIVSATVFPSLHRYKRLSYHVSSLPSVELEVCFGYFRPTVLVHRITNNTDLFYDNFKTPLLLLYPRKELQIHLLTCEEMQRECEIKGCHFFGNLQSMDVHKCQQAEKHVELLKEEKEKILDAILNKVHNSVPHHTFNSIKVVCTTPPIPQDI